MALINYESLKNSNRSNFVFEKRSYEHNDVSYAVNRLNEQISPTIKATKYDIFLSHSINDAPVILALKRRIENYGLSVYVDWINNPMLNRGNVTKETAKLIRNKIKNCKSLLYAYSSNSSLSSWVQWELGYGDGNKNGKVAIVPIQREGDSPDFYKQEYLKLYPIIEAKEDHLDVTDLITIDLKKWLRMTDPLEILKD